MVRKTKKVDEEECAKNAAKQRDYRNRKKDEQTLMTPPEIKIKIKDMTDEQRKEYNRMKQAELRKRQAEEYNVGASTSTAPYPMEDDSMSVCSEYSTTTVFSQDLRPVFSQTTKKIKDMTLKEKREYNNDKQAARRMSQKMAAAAEAAPDAAPSSPLPPAVPPSTQATPPPRPPPPSSSSRKRNTTNPSPAEKQPRTEVIPESQKNVKIRLGWIDLFLVETLTIVIPYYGEHETETSVHSQFLKKIETHQIREDIKIGMNGDWKEKMSNFEPVINTSDTYADSVHISPPVCTKGSKFTPVTEAQLRATYLGILLHVDAARRKSVAMPILGKGFERARSVFVALQTFYYYFQAVEETNLELVYIVTIDEKEYDILVEFVDYFREFDLTYWTRSMFHEMEQLMYDNLFKMGEKLQQLRTDKRKRSMKMKKMTFATMPGTDMVLRVIKTSFTSRQKRLEQKEIDSIHEKMCSMTSVPYTPAKHYDNGGTNCMRLPVEYIRLPPSLPYMYVGMNTHMGFQCFPIIARQCGSYAVKRKLWFISYYYMYFSDVKASHCRGQPNMTCQKFRRLIYPKLKGLHKGVAKEWRRIRRHAPYTCDCREEHHENFMVFSTEMSHHDPIYHEWISHHRTTVFPINETSLLEFENNWIPRLHSRDPNAETLDVQEMQWTEEYRAKVEDWHAQLETFLTDQSRNTRAIFERLNLENFPTGNDRVVINELDFDLNYQNEIEDDECVEPRIVEARKMLADAERAKQEAEEGFEDREAIAELVVDVQKSIKNLHLAQWILQNKRTWKTEQVLRNRLFRKDVSRFESREYAEFWFNGSNKPETVESYLRCWCNEFYEGNFNLCDTTVDSRDCDENMEYPELINLGKRKYPCKYCGAFAFACETGHSCCKSGKVWIDPIPKLPRPINWLFQPKYRNYLLGTNTAFSMASIHYHRVPQARGGVQSMKIRGLISFHVSALRPHNPKDTRYANFIVLDNGNEEIAKMRFSSLMNSNAAPAGLKDIFLAIQEYMDQNNCLTS